MQFPFMSQAVTGTAIPVGALRTDESVGCGEFLDLIPFAQFCNKAGMNLIQLLPVNDTGTESSPYSALSAFALHPLYIRLQNLPEAKSFKDDIAALRTAHAAAPRFDYKTLRNAKIDLLHRIFEKNEKQIVESRELADWIANNPWIVIYAVFMNLKRRNFDASWKAWHKLKNPTHAEIQDRWKSDKRKADHLFFAWVQMRLDEQFTLAVKECEKLGVALKGDIPIMMNEDSCDAWANPEFFRDDLRAGSPPDGSNPLGQNWGFPIYNWDNLEADDYSWWKARLRHAERYYHAYRIDHILGFFRIWSIPYGENSGALGWSNPQEFIASAELAELGFTGDRLRWIREPHVPTRAVEEVNNFDYLGSHGIMRVLMDRIGEEELWLFKDSVRCEQDIWNADIPHPVKEVLARSWRDRMILSTGRDAAGKPLYAPAWFFRESTAWKSLADWEKERFNALTAAKAARNEQLWKEHAEKLLGTLTKSVKMLACAEDLGTIPETVPEVLGKLEILGLKVVRWERKWNENGQPFRDLADYPQLSVATTSVHDSSTMRGWWENEGGARGFLDKWNPDPSDGVAEDIRSNPTAYTPRAASFALKTIAAAKSSLLVIPFQDLLALSQYYAPRNSDDERINIPGSVTAFNWTWRIPAEISNFLGDRELISKIKEIVKQRS